LKSAERIAIKRQFDCIFLAAASLDDFFADALSVVPRRFGRSRTFAMHDGLEAKDAIVPIVYLRSLLYFISGVLEASDDAPIVGMERYDRNSNVYPSRGSVGATRVSPWAEKPRRVVYLRRWSRAEQSR
jgi:hypothetical protein